MAQFTEQAKRYGVLYCVLRDKSAKGDDVPVDVIARAEDLSLIHIYWVVPADFDGKYADYNLYENRFSEALSLVAYTGVGGSREAFSSTGRAIAINLLRFSV